MMITAKSRGWIKSHLKENISKSLYYTPHVPLLHHYWILEDYALAHVGWR